MTTPAGPVTVTAFVESLARRGQSAETIAAHRKVLRAAEGRLQRPLVEVDPGTWARYLADLAERAAPTTVAVYRRKLRAYLRWAGASVPEVLDATARLSVTPAWQDALEAWTVWLRAAGHPSTTIGMRLEHLRQFSRDAGVEPFAVVTGDLVDWLGNDHWTTETRYSRRTTLRSFYRWAHTAEHVEVDPSAALPRVRRQPPKPRPLPEEHLHATLERVDERSRFLLELAAGYGLRRGEVAAIHSRDVLTDPAGRHTLLVHGKGGKGRHVPISDATAARIRSRAGFTFPGQERGHLSARWVGRLISTALPEGYTMHTARHLFATTAYHLTRDLFAVQELLGHASAETTRRYVATSDDTRRAVVDAVSAYQRGAR